MARRGQNQSQAQLFGRHAPAAPVKEANGGERTNMILREMTISVIAFGVFNIGRFDCSATSRESLEIGSKLSALRI